MYRRLILLALVAFALAKNTDRQGRFFRGAYTTTILEPHTITSVVPASCLQMEPTLSPCRNVRQLHGFPQVSGYTIHGPLQELSSKHKISFGGILRALVSFFDGSSTAEPSANNHAYLQAKMEPILNTPLLGWQEYFGFVPYTVTKIQPTRETITVQDPNIMVTFSVGGCRPAVLPVDVARCQPLFSIQEILPTSTVLYEVKPTETIDATFDEEIYNGPFIESTEKSRVPVSYDLKPTENIDAAFEKEDYNGPFIEKNRVAENVNR